MARRTFTSSSPTPSLTNHSTDWRISKPAPRRFSTIAKLLRFSLGLLFSRFRGAASQWCASRSSCGVPARTRLCTRQPDFRPASWARAQAHPIELRSHQALLEVYRLAQTSRSSANHHTNCCEANWRGGTQNLEIGPTSFLPHLLL